MDNCPFGGEYDVCRVENGYTRYVGKSSSVELPKATQTAPQRAPRAMAQVESRGTASGHLVEARRSRAGAVLALIRRLKKHEDQNIPYSTINSYFRTEFKAGGDSSPFGMFTDLLTYDPRNDSPKTYAQVYTSINQYAESLDWLSLWDVIDGLAYD